MRATEDLFWPIATYMHMVSFLFWFNIVSMAIEVFPVLESPIINSLCPWPIGTKLSTTLIPVSNGTLTEVLAIIEGALVSILLRNSHFKSPLSSKGSPNGLTTLPKR